MDLTVPKYIWQHNDGSFGEFRLIQASVNAIKQFFIEKNAEAPEEVEGMIPLGFDAYFGVLPRINRGGKASDVADLQRTLWADFDSKNRQKDEAFRAALSVRPSPQIIVDSGNGYHAYWLLRNSIGRWQAENTMRGIAIRHGGDRTYDAARVLRVPGTLNYKTSPSMDVRLLKFDTTVMYHGSDFQEYFEVGLRNSLPAFDLNRERYLIRDTVEPIDVQHEYLADLIKTTGNQKGTRSEEAFKVVCMGIERGYSQADIEGWFIDNPRGIGQKYHEKRNGHRWFMVTFRAAQKSILSSKQHGF